MKGERERHFNLSIVMRNDTNATELRSALNSNCQFAVRIVSLSGYAVATLHLVFQFVTGNCFFQVLFAQAITINSLLDMLFAQM
mgnify:CR=1 FL=1